MIKLDAGNVLLKPSHRKQLMGWLKRAVRLGERVGDFMLTVSMERTGRRYEARALVHNSAGDFDCRARQRGLAQHSAGPGHIADQPPARAAVSARVGAELRAGQLGLAVGALTGADR